MEESKYITRIDRLHQIPENERERLKAVAAQFPFRTNSYYLSLIDWDDPSDPIRRIIIPDIAEMIDAGDLDACNEQTNYVAPGCQHKYPHTALLVCSETCASFCRYCFRKRLFMHNLDEAATNPKPALEYIRSNTGITNVLLTGGDPLMLSTRRLEKIISGLRDIDHIEVIRIGSKVPAFNPYRILDDSALAEMLSKYSTPEKRLYLMSHFDVAEELTEAARAGIDVLMRAGVIIANQSPIIRGVNDTPERLSELMRQLSFTGVPPYYFFQCRPTAGNQPFAVPLVEAFFAVEKAMKYVSGLAKRARFVMSHALGKIEIVGITDDYIFMRFHRARYQEDEGRFMMYHRNDDAYWLDDLIPADGQPHPVHERHHGLLTPRVRCVAR